MENKDADEGNLVEKGGVTYRAVMCSCNRDRELLFGKDVVAAVRAHNDNKSKAHCISIQFDVYVRMPWYSLTSMGRP